MNYFHAYTHQVYIYKYYLEESLFAKPLHYKFSPFPKPACQTFEKGTSIHSSAISFPHIYNTMYGRLWSFTILYTHHNEFEFKGNPFSLSSIS